MGVSQQDAAAFEDEYARTHTHSHTHTLTHTAPYYEQLRGGCVCAGPYGLQLLGVSPQDAAAFEEELRKGRNEPIRPGFVRLSLPFFASEAEVDYVVEAVRQVWHRLCCLSSHISCA